jgi:aminoglycoside/choline kinase family phosphotransferase
LDRPDTQSRVVLPDVTQFIAGALREAELFAKSVEEMPPGASTRRFFRVVLADGKSLVAMYAPGTMGGPSAARQATGHGPFMATQALLAGWGLPVPAIIGSALERDLLFVEDLGEETLAQHLLRCPESAQGLYAEAVRQLSRAQAAFANAPSQGTVGERAFDYDLLRFEVDHFLDWALLARGAVLSQAQRDVFEAAADFLAKSIASLRRGFVHRDYQSKNLMVRERAAEKTLTWIDFQDAMLGPRAYDLVALLMDSYQNLDDAFVQARLHDYLGADSATDYAALRREFDLITVQRKLKDAGRFVYLERQRGNPSFLRYVDAAITRATAALDRIEGQAPELARLAEFLAEVLPLRSRDGQVPG